MTNITGARVIGNYAVTNGRVQAAARIPLTVRGIIGAGVRRRARHREMVAAQSTWDSEGGATGENESLAKGVECRAPRGLGG
jgi:hypothetical protein